LFADACSIEIAGFFPYEVAATVPDFYAVPYPASLLFQIIMAVPHFDTVTLPGPGFDEVSTTVTDLLVCRR
jgi:hypothetical protein